MTNQGLRAQSIAQPVLLALVERKRIYLKSALQIFQTSYVPCEVLAKIFTNAFTFGIDSFIATTMKWLGCTDQRPVD